MKKGLSVFISLVFIVFLVVMILVVIYNSAYTKGKAPTFFNHESFIVTSGSMKKTISPGDLVISSKTDELFVGDIIVFRKFNENTTHRIVAIMNYDGVTHYVTKGDNNPTNDIYTVSRNEVLGKVVIIVPMLGYLINFLRTQTGILIVVIIPAFVLFLYYLEKVYKDLSALSNKKRREKDEKGY